MGTPTFAVPTLIALMQSKHNIIDIFTCPPKPKGRNLVEQISPVHQFAMTHNINVHTPKTLKNQSDAISKMNPDVIIVVAYGLIIPGSILSIPKIGCLNIHPSSLPKYRGAAPMQWTIINQEQTSAVCIMQMDDGIDTGDVLLREEIQLPKDITLNILQDKCSAIGSRLILKVLDNFNQIVPQPQSSTGASYARKITKDDGAINWNRDRADQINAKIRAFSTWPSVYFKYKENVIKILDASYTTDKHDKNPGTIINAYDALEIACIEGILIIKLMQRSGKKPLIAKEFLRGFNIPVGYILSNQ